MRLAKLVPSNKKNSLLILLTAIAITAGAFVIPAKEPLERVNSFGLPNTFESAQVEQLREQYVTETTQPAIVVYSRDDKQALNSSDKEVIEKSAAQLATLSVAPAGPVITSKDNKVSFSTVVVASDKGDERIIEQVNSIRSELSSLPEPLNASVTGGPGFVTDLTKVFEGANSSLLLTTVAVVAVLLIITYRSPVLWLIPITVVGMAEQLTARMVELLAPYAGIVVDPSATGIASILVFGAGTNYALLLIARYRDELHTHENRFEAMKVAWARTFEPIFASAMTVTISLSVLLLALLASTRAIGFAGSIGIILALLFTLFVLPAALVLFGRSLFWPRVPRKDDKGISPNSVWSKIGQKVMARPKIVLLAGIVVLAAFISGAQGLTIGLSQNKQFRVKPEAVIGQETLAQSFPSGATEPVTILVKPDTIDEAAAVISQVPNVASVRPAENVGNYAQLNAVLSVAPRSDESYQAIQDNRESLAKISGADALVGGQVAAGYDVSTAANRDQWLIAPIILLIVSLVLVILLRSVVAAILLVLSVVLTFFASIGASWFIFQTLAGIPALDTGVLLLSFLFLVALGVDYNIFLATRAREEAEKSSTREGMLTALKVTGGVITSAGILLAAVFAVLGVLPLITLTQIGVIVGIGVLLDTLLVRTILVPALVFSLDDKFWWPNFVKNKSAKTLR